MQSVGEGPLALPTFELIEAVVERVPEAGTAHVETARRAGVVAKDAPVIAAAFQCGADVFVTGDTRHFGHLFGERLEGVPVLSLRAALDHLAARPRVSHDPAVRRTRKNPKAK